MRGLIDIIASSQYLHTYVLKSAIYNELDFWLEMQKDNAEAYTFYLFLCDVQCLIKFEIAICISQMVN